MEEFTLPTQLSRVRKQAMSLHAAVQKALDTGISKVGNNKRDSLDEAVFRYKLRKLRSKDLLQSSIHRTWDRLTSEKFAAELTQQKKSTFGLLDFGKNVD